MTMQGYFRCRHSGLLFPGDYYKMWGKKYGIGLGPTPVSEVLDTDYNQRAVAGRDGIRRHPVGICYADVDYVERDPATLTEKDFAVLQIDDPDMVRRAAIVREKQLKNSVMVN